jgi:adenylyl cyclase-associated protein
MSSSDIVAMLKGIQDRLSNIELSVGINTPDSSSGSSGGPVIPRSIKAYDAYLSSHLDPFVATCNLLGGDAEKSGQIVKEGWNEARKFLLLASSCKEPAPAALPKLLQGVTGKMGNMRNVMNRNEWEKHTKALNEGIACLSWLQIKPAPVDYIETFIGGFDYHANGIRKEYRTTNPTQIDFCNQFKELIKELMVYVKEHHTCGVSWNSKGCDVSEYSSCGGDAPVAAPVKVEPVKVAETQATNTTAPSKGDLFASLSKGGAITGGLKTVTKDMQTWRSEYKGGDAPAPVVKAAPVATKKPVAKAKGPPILEFQVAASKWVVENQTKEQGVVTVEVKDKKETIYIYGCIDATIDIKGKCKSIVLDSCKKTNVLFDSAMASCESVNCQRIQVQCRGTCPSIAIDKVDGIVVFLAKESMDTELVCSKSSEMNISWPNDEGDMIERPVPEQYVHRIKDNQITVEVSSLYSH